MAEQMEDTLVASNARGEEVNLQGSLSLIRQSTSTIPASTRAQSFENPGVACYRGSGSWCRVYVRSREARAALGGSDTLDRHGSWRGGRRGWRGCSRNRGCTSLHDRNGRDGGGNSGISGGGRIVLTEAARLIVVMRHAPNYIVVGLYFVLRARTQA